MKSLQPSVSIILLNWNGWRDTIDCLDSLVSLDYNDYRVLVVDNGSTDDSVARIHAAHPKIPIIETGRNLGFSGGCNVGIRRALEDGADYVWLLNNDTTVDPQALSAMVAVADADPLVGAVGSVLYYLDSPKDIQAWGGGRVCFWSGRARNHLGPVPSTRFHYLIAASILLRRRALDDIGLLDENTFFMYWEDTDFSFRLRKAGWHLAVADRSIVLHSGNAATGKGSPLLDYYVNKSAVRFFRRYAPIAVWPIFISTLGRSVKRVLQGNLSGFVATLRGAYAGLRKNGVIVHTNSRPKTLVQEERAANPNGLTINRAEKGKQILQIVVLARKNPDLLKQFFREMRQNGIKYAVKKAWAVAQRHSALPTTATKSVADLWNLFSQSPNIPQFDVDVPIDIIIPVYNGGKYLEPLFSSIISNTMLPYRLLVADDKSTDAAILPLLYAIKSKNPNVDITIIENSENMGFVKTVNKLAQMARGNFVLLNTDVEVPPHWLERLIYPLVKMDGVASVTPFTNSGTICSFPNYLQDNDLPSGMDVNFVDYAFSFVKLSDNIIEIPTGIGFCMGINKAVWDEIGGFDEVFDKGYGEENDWCMRASRFGYRNLHVPNLFVYHKHGGSFLPEDKKRYRKNNLAIVNKRYPDYLGKVQQLIENNAFSFLRKCVLVKALCEKYGSIAIFDHNFGGGANQYTAEFLSTLPNHKISIVIRYNTIRCEFEVSFRSKDISDLTIKTDTLPDIKNLVSFFNVRELVINNLVSYPKFIDFIDFICGLMNERIHLTYMMHDFYAICPMYNLINYEMEYCGIPEDHDYCAKCLKSNPLIREQVPYISSKYPTLSISDWRAHFGRLLDLADKIVFFSQNSLAITSKAYPQLCLHTDKLEVKPHKVTWARRVATGAPGDIINIGIIGNLSFTKGIHIVSALAGYIDSCQLNYKFHVFGEVTDPQIGLDQYACVTLHGRYERDELPCLMEQAHIDIILIPSVWPETFSYTTEEAIVMNLPVAVFDIGAPSERVSKYAKGIILRNRSPRSIIESITDYFGHPPILQRKAQQEQEDEIVFVCVSNNEHTYQHCVSASAFMTAHRIIKYNNNEHNIPIPIRYNSAISELLDANYHGWIFFVHNDFAIMENLLPIVKNLPKEAIYGPIGAILNNDKKQIYGEILQGHNGGLITHGAKIDRPTPVDTVDCQCIFFHSDTLRKYPLRFDEANPLSFHQYTEEFCLTAKDQAGLQTYAVQIKCKHLSWGQIDESFDRAIRYINRKHGKRRWAGTCTHLDQS